MENIEDQGAFLRIAMNISKDCTFSASAADEKEFCVTRPPLYPILIGMIWKVFGNRNPDFIKWLQTVVVLLTIYFQYKTAFLLTGSSRYGLWTAFILSLIPQFVATASMVLTECLAMLLLSANVYLIVRLKDGHRKSIILLGLVSGLLSLQRPTFFYMPLFLVPLLVVYSKSISFRNIIIYLFVYLAVLLPWGVWNYSNTGVFSLTRPAGMGFNSVVGILQADNKIPEIVPRVRELLAKRELHHGKMDFSIYSNGISDGQIYKNDGVLTALAIYLDSWSLHPPPPDNVIMADIFLRNAAVTWIKDNPLGFARVLVNNLRELLFGRYNPLIYQDMKKGYFLVFDLVRYGVYSLFLLGLIKGVRKRMYKLILPPVVVICYLSSVHMFFHAEPRYFIYAYIFMPIVIPLLWYREDAVGIQS